MNVKFTDGSYVVEGYRFDGTSEGATSIQNALSEFDTHLFEGPDWGPNGAYNRIELNVGTIAGYVRVNSGDWVVKHMNNTLMLYSDEDFNRIYSPVLN